MIELHQAEWCPHSRRVRQRLTELGVPFVARQVPAAREDRDALRATTGDEAIPAVLLEDGSVLCGDADAIIERLDALHAEREDAAAHRAKAAEHADEVPYATGDRDPSHGTDRAG